jgi:hypothetical protein
MKNLFYIGIIFLTIFSNNLFAEIVLSDTLDNKGLHAVDSLTSATLDTTITNDSLTIKSSVKQNNFIRQTGLSDSSSYITRISRSFYSTEDYRNFSDILTYSPFAFLQDLGSLGQANEQMLYGLGFRNISYIRDGILLNNRFQNSFDLNRLNNEIVDSVEIAPITKGFLYGTYNNPVSVVFTNRTKFSMRPITQLKFFQASYDEGMVDVLFNLPVSKKFNVGINVSNTAIDSRFSNSDYESWKVNTQLLYQVNDEVNIIANYFFTYDTLALFGGLDTNKMLDDNFSTVLYDANGNNSSRYQLTYNNSGSIKVLLSLFPNLKSNFTVYLNSSSQQYIQNSDQSFENIPRISHENNFFTYGISLRNIYTQKSISADIIANYETTKSEGDLFSQDYNQDYFSVSGDLKFPINNNKYFIPSVFGKISSYAGKMLIGYGADISGSLSKHLSYYGSISHFESPLTLLEKEASILDSDVNPNPSVNNAVEIGLKLDYKNVWGKILYFNFKSEGTNIPYSEQSIVDSLLINEATTFVSKDIRNSGISFNLNFSFWKFIFSNNFSYYFSSRSDRVYASPDFTLAGKLFFNDIMFDNNLKLKMGINYRYTGGQIPFVYDYEKSLQLAQTLTPMVTFSAISPTFQLDLFLAGTVQEQATIFVTFENALDTEYYIVPYYFKQATTLRLGVSWLLYD